MSRLELDSRCVASAAAQQVQAGKVHFQEGDVLPPCLYRQGNEQCRATYVIGENNLLHRTSPEGIGCMALLAFIDGTDGA